jgi:hypothetical protein
MIATKLPEPGLIAFNELQAVKPLGGFPEVQMRHEQSRRAAMIRFERATLITRCDHRLSVDEIGGRNVRGIAIV